MKYIVIDVETTGLDERKKSLVQLACIVYNNNKLVGSFNEICKAKVGSKTTTNQSIINKATLSYKYMFKFFNSFLDKHINKYDKKDKLFFVAYNSQFDEKFIRQFFKDNGNNFYGSYFHNPSICVMRLAAYRLMLNRGKLDDFKLSTVARYLKIRVNDKKLHDAEYDIQITKRVWDKLRKVMKCQRTTK